MKLTEYADRTPPDFGDLLDSVDPRVRVEVIVPGFARYSIFRYSPKEVVARYQRQSVRAADFLAGHRADELSFEPGILDGRHLRNTDFLSASGDVMIPIAFAGSKIKRIEQSVHNCRECQVAVSDDVPGFSLNQLLNYEKSGLAMHPDAKDLENPIFRFLFENRQNYELRNTLDAVLNEIKYDLSDHLNFSEADRAVISPEDVIITANPDGLLFTIIDFRHLT
ncbi:hypothetical protein A2Z33_04345 [Candidatus Gottesmanbacteria bacterium RBG_16_52_11]|uniref:Uncharacterized protein n=1 Tax=Candidatus Gottesmanbacteria bacterium RBG_16_52_11 TaxID=1798374 RepID=A0A1F5YW74_9BACT|nr:MAG: hypothetical protein A2Z33_04345 [Candidatus Gottesmanbacteria bacterium RBG_16_52_11]